MWPVLVILVVGALDMWRRGTSFHWGTYGGAVGALAGAVALAVAWVTTGGWAEDRDPVALLALAVATELALRGWLVERIYRGGIVARHRSRRNAADADDAAGSRTGADDAVGSRTGADDAAGSRTSAADAAGSRTSAADAAGSRTGADGAAGSRTGADGAAGSRTGSDDAAGSWTSETRAVLAVLVGAIAEGLLTPGNLTARIGAGVFGAGLGWMYVRAGLMAPVAARLVFVLGGLALQLPW
jgi:hypothetical protein